MAKERFIKEGREEVVEEVALAMLARDVDATLIAEVTGLKPEELDKLKI